MCDPLPKIGNSEKINWHKMAMYSLNLITQKNICRNSSAMHTTYY